MEMTNLVKLIRKNADLTQEKAANLLNVEKRTWERWEEGSRSPSMQNLELFCIKSDQNLENSIKECVLNKLKKDGYQFPKEILEIFELTSFEFLDKDIEKNYRNWLESMFSFNEIVYLLSINDNVILDELKNIIKSDKEDEDLFDLDNECFSINDFSFYKNRLAH